MIIIGMVFLGMGGRCVCGVDANNDSIVNFIMEQNQAKYSNEFEWNMDHKFNVRCACHK